MKKTIQTLRKLSGIFVVALLLCLTFLPAAALAVECDADKDGYIALTQNMLEVVVADNIYQEDGNYSPDQWKGIFDAYKANLATDSGIDERYACDSVNFKKGAEPVRCDGITVSPRSGVYDTARVTSLNGNKVNPGTFDAPDDGIDQDCDGADGQLLAGSGGDKDLSGLVDKVVKLLGNAVAVLSIIVLIWGGIMYSTAAGDEQKTSKARKAIIGAIVGLIVGLLAPTVVHTITAGLA
jgi:hypothetical protein